MDVPVDKDEEWTAIQRAERQTTVYLISTQVQPRDEFIQELVEALEKMCKCPNGCIGGAIPTMPDGEPEQCQWCFTYGHELSLLSRARDHNFTT